MAKSRVQQLRARFSGIGSTWTEKYPRTPHFPFSPGATSDDRILTSFEHLVGVPVVVTEKMDGSNLSFTHEMVFARSHAAAPSHPSFDYAKAIHAQLRHAISPGMSVFGEWVYALHSIPYANLPGYFMVFGVRDDAQQVWYSWDEVRYVAVELGLPTVPELWRGVAASEQELRGLVEHWARQPSWYGPQREGVVVRTAEGFRASEFAPHVAKWVRVGHVQTDEHWTRQRIVPNRLAR